MALQTRRTYQIIFFCNDLTGAYYNQMYHGMAKTAKERDIIFYFKNDYDFESVKKILGRWNYISDRKCSTGLC